MKSIPYCLAVVAFLYTLVGLSIPAAAEEYRFEVCFYEGRAATPVFKGTLSGNDNSVTLSIPADAKEGKYEMVTCDGVWPDGTKSLITVSNSGKNQTVRSVTKVFGNTAEDIEYRNPVKKGNFNLFIDNRN